MRKEPPYQDWNPEGSCTASAPMEKSMEAGDDDICTGWEVSPGDMVKLKDGRQAMVEQMIHPLHAILVRFEDSGFSIQDWFDLKIFWRRLK